MKGQGQDRTLSRRGQLHYKGIFIHVSAFTQFFQAAFVPSGECASHLISKLSAPEYTLPVARRTHRVDDAFTSRDRPSVAMVPCPALKQQGLHGVVNRIVNRIDVFRS